MNVLLLGAGYYGTLAAARCYGKNGVPVTMADESPRATGLFSRHVRERLVHPPLANPAELVDWLVAFGDRRPGTVLYPPSDHLAWLFAAHRDRLSQSFLTYTPTEETLIALLDKQRLHTACAAVGIAVPETRTRLGDARSDLAALGWPVLVKPRTQVFLEGGIKGFLAHDEEELSAALERFRRLVRFNPVLTERHPGIAEPMVQEYLPAAETKIFSVSGFVTKSGELACRAAMKVLQRPRKVGIGLCFEGRTMDDALADKIAALCEHVGYYGAFEAELVVDGDRRMLIDFNPRFFSQMGFDLARELRLPMMVWHAARGDQARLDEEMSRARAWTPSGREIYCHKTMLDMLLALQSASGRMPRAEVERWRRWYDEHRVTATDAVRDPEDFAPTLADAARWAAHFARHPRSFVRSFVLDR